MKLLLKDKRIYMMKNKFIYFSVCFIQLFTQNIFGQGVTNSNDIFHIYSPEVYALARYGDIPVDHSTGVPDISVPLMSISDKDISLNVSLSYHATGIQVDQEATWVGLGWVLNAGGMITRQVRGNKDGYYGYPPKFSDRPDIQDYDYTNTLPEYLRKSNLATRLASLESGHESNDGEPDIFYYNFCGRSGKFFLDNNAKGCFFKHEDFKIEYPGKFIITDDSGIIYEFSTSPYDMHNALSDKSIYGDIWHLTKITSPSGGEISLEYESRYTKNILTRQHSTYFLEADYQQTSSHRIYASILHAGDLFGNGLGQYALLSKIKTKSGHYIQFNLSPTQRMDAENASGKALEEIVLYNNQNEVLKKANLGYDYFEANTRHRYRDENNKELASMNHLNYRLRLKSVKEISNSGVAGAQYRFEYYGDDNPATEDAYTLPYRLSASQDHWGYYNQSNNITMFPNNPSGRMIAAEPWLDWVIGMGYFGTSTDRVSDGLWCNTITGGANREPDTEAVKAGTLNKIIYPTGGYTKFDFELHSGFGTTLGGGLRVKQIESTDGKGNAVIKDYEYEAYWGEYLEYYHNGVPSPYHTIYYNTYTDLDFSRNDIGVKIARMQMNMGVPSEIALKGFFHAIKIDGTSRLKLGLGNEVSYTKVTEKTKGVGRTEYYYSCMDDFTTNWTDVKINGKSIGDLFTLVRVRTQDVYPDPADFLFGRGSSHIFPYAEPVSNQWRNRLLTNKKIYRQDGALIAEDSLSYNVEVLHAIPNYKVFKMGEYEYTYSRSYTIGGSVNVSKEVSRQYTPEGTVVRTSKEYDYSSLYHKKPTEIRTILSQGGNITEKYYYPTEYGSYFQTLVNKNILSPVDIRSYRNGKLVSGVQVQYDSNGLPLIKYKSEPVGMDISFNKSNPFTFTPYLWNSYNTANLLASQKTRDDVTTVFLWSYTNQYPIAEIRNATFTEVEAAAKTVFSVTSADALSVLATPNETKLKDGSLQKALPNALVTTYTYKPLAGILTATDPTSLTTRYEYDAFNRLGHIRNQDNNLITEYNYNYTQSDYWVTPINGSENYIQDNNCDFEISDNSKNYNYSYGWRIETPLGEIITNEVVSTLKTFNVKLSRQGNMVVFCKVYLDGKYTGIEIKKNFYVDYKPLSSKLTYEPKTDYTINESCTLRLQADGGSGQFSYIWKVLLPNGTTEILPGTTGSVTYSFKNSGYYQFTCTVKDNVTGKEALPQSEMISVRNMILYIDPQLGIFGKYFVGTNASFTVSVNKGGSGQYSYQWEFRDYYTGEVEQQQSSSNVFKPNFTDGGQKTIACKVTDLGTGRVEETKMDVIVLSQIIEWEDEYISTSQSSVDVRRSFYLNQQTTLIFNINAYFSDNFPDIYVHIGGKLVVRLQNKQYDNTFSLTLPKGDCKVEIFAHTMPYGEIRLTLAGSETESVLVQDERSIVVSRYSSGY